MEMQQISDNLMCSKYQTRDFCANATNPPDTYSRPILLQHFPTYRESDAECTEHDSPFIEYYREEWEVVSMNATEYLRQKFEPRLALSGHSHHFCATNSRLGVPEYTIASFSWRNKNNPSFLLVIFCYSFAIRTSLKT